MKKLTAILLVLVLLLTTSATTLAVEGGSDVKFTLSSTQISIQMPVSIDATVGHTVTGDDTVTLTWPTPSSTTITNNSVFPVKVDSIACTNLAEGWALAATDEDAEDTIVATVQAGASGPAVALLTESQTCTGTQWNIGAVTETAHAIELTFAGNIHNPGTATSGIAGAAVAPTVFRIVFTVSSGVHS